MAGLFKLKAEFPDARLVVGNTEVGIEMKFKDARYPVLIGVTHIPELNRMEVSWVSGSAFSRFLHGSTSAAGSTMSKEKGMYQAKVQKCCRVDLSRLDTWSVPAVCINVCLAMWLAKVHGEQRYALMFAKCYRVSALTP